MSNNQLAGFPAFGPRVDSNIIYHPREVTFDPEVAITASYPETAQVEFAIQAADLPTFSGLPVPLAYGLSNTGCLFQVVAFIRSIYTAKQGIYAQYWNSSTWQGITTANIPANGKMGISGTGPNGAQIGSSVKIRIACDYSNTVYLTGAALIAYPYILGVTTMPKLIDFEADLSANAILSTRTTSNYTGCYLNIGDGLNSTSWFQKTGITSNVRLSGIHKPYSGSVAILYSAGVVAMAPDSSVYKYYQPYYPTRIAYTPIL